MPMTSIQVGDTVNVSLSGAHATTLELYEVLQVPSNVTPYWEFRSLDGNTVTAVNHPVTVTKVP